MRNARLARHDSRGVIAIEVRHHGIQQYSTGRSLLQVKHFTCGTSRLLLCTMLCITSTRNCEAAAVGLRLSALWRHYLL